MEKFENASADYRPGRESGIDRVRAPSEGIARAVMDEAREIFEDQKPVEWEREKTPEELAVVREVLEHLPEFVREYGGEPLPLREDHFHFVDWDAIPEEKKATRSKAAAFFEPSRQRVIVQKRARNAHNLAGWTGHEGLHFNMYHSAKVVGDRAYMQRAGLSMAPKEVTSEIREAASGGSVDPEMLHFNALDEAVVDELVKRFDKRFVKTSASPAFARLNADFASLVEASRGKLPDDVLEDAEWAESKREPGGWRHDFKSYGHPEERTKLWGVCHDVWWTHPGEFDSPEDVFRMLAKASFDGKVLRVARMIEDTYGEGSYRTMAAGLLGFETIAERAGKKGGST